MSGLRHAAARFRGDARGVSAVEFALFAPFLFVAGVAMLDVGAAVNDRMAMDRLLSAGAAAAMADPGADEVRNVIEASAPSGFAPGAEFTLAVDRFCACAAAPDTPVGCGSTCSGDPPAVYYEMAAERTYPAMMLPDIPLSTAAEVRVR